MKIHILVHSKTGNTRKFADAIQAMLAGSGHDVALTQLQTLKPAEGTKPGQLDTITITNMPDIKDAQIILLGTPVWGFRSAPVIIAAIRQLGPLTGKRVVPFVTMGFPFKCLGGNKTLREIGLNAATRGASVLPGAVVRATKSKFDADLGEAVAKIKAIVAM